MLDQSLRDRLIILATTVLAFSALYAPQPILPRLAGEFATDPARVSLLITATLLPLGLAPVFYGYWLESLPARSLLRGAVLLLALAQLPFLFVDNLWLLIAVRLFQGLLLPAIFTSLMTYLSTTTPVEQVRGVMATYIAATILGGFFGRALSGLVAGFTDWRVTFALLALGLGLSWWALGRLTLDARTRFARLEADAALRVLADRVYRQAYAIIFLVFFVFASLLNLLPFRLTELSQELSEGRIALVYSGYLVGVIIALSSMTLTRRLGGEAPTILLGLGAYTLGVALFALPSTTAVFAVMWLFCAGMFLVHSVLSGYLNHRALERKGVVNGLYIAFYYAGGTLGSFLPGWLYRHFGWNSYIVLLLGMLGVALGLGVALRRQMVAG